MGWPPCIVSPRIVLHSLEEIRGLQQSPPDLRGHLAHSAAAAVDEAHSDPDSEVLVVLVNYQRRLVATAVTG